MSKALSPQGYPAFLASLKERILHARTSAARAVNHGFLAQSAREILAILPWRHHLEILAKVKLPVEFKGRLPTARQLADAVRDIIPQEK